MAWLGVPCRRLPRPLFAAVVVALPPSAAAADEPVLHEFFVHDAAEDLALGATTPDGRLAAAIDTPSGVVPAPPPGAGPAAPAHVYGVGAHGAAEADEYRIDRNTTRPSSVEYEDPFTPSVAPFKRSFAYDAVDEQLQLRVSERGLRALPVGGGPRADEDQFYADLAVDLDARGAVRIPSVGPGTRVLALQTFPETPLELLHDAADNWFVRAAARRRVRVTLQLAIPRAVFGSPFADVAYEALAAPPALPPDAARAAGHVLERIGVSRALRPRDAVGVLVGYFRGFAPSTDLPSARSPAALYEEIALSRKGVCRHRAYAFVLTAWHLGLPARFVRNEAHAWVELHDGRIWHRVDLGGAAGHLDFDATASGFLHVPPPDPTPWPEGAESAADLARRTSIELAARPPGSPPGAGAWGAPTAPGASLLAPPAVPLPAAAPREPAEMSLGTAERAVRRGEPLRLEGSVQQRGRPCAGARVDVALHRAGADPIPLGSLPTGSDGRFAGAVTVRLDLEVGEYDVVASTPGTLTCGPAEAR